jgi:hypothetical protein
MILVVINGMEGGKTVMANRTKAESVAKVTAAGIPLNAFNTEMLCARNGISVQHHRQLEKKGRGCKSIDVDGVKIHTVQQEREWLATFAESETAA